MAEKYNMCLDIGGTKILGAIFDKDDKIIYRLKKKTKEEGDSEGNVEQVIIKVVDEMLKGSGINKKQVQAISVGAPGVIDQDKGIVLFSPNLPWRNYDIKTPIEKKFGIPFIIGNDVNVGVLGEYKYGAAKGYKNVVGFFVGTCMGGGSLLGLSNLLLNVRNFDVLRELAETGNLANVDLTVGDISKGDIATLPPHTTASNFGKISDVASKNDIALAIFNLVFQTIGVMAVFAAKGQNRNEAVLIGNLTTLPYCSTVMKGLEELHGFKFVIPEHAEYGTAIGAALATRRPEAPYTVL